jgi:protein-tyrosine kinase
MNMQPLKFPSRSASPAARTIGAILVEAGRLNEDQAELIARFQQDSGLRFGEAGMRIGLLTGEDVRSALSRQFDLPCPSPGAADLSAEILAAYRPHHPLVESLRALRSELLLRWLDSGPGGKSLVLVSAGRGEGRSFVAANLAVLFAQLGRRTLLIDADLRSPRQHELFRLENRIGLSSVLAERADIEAIGLVPALAGLSVLTAGPTPPNPQELLSRPRFVELLEQARGLFDVVLIDSPAWSTAADVQMIAARAGAALLVSRPHAAAVEQVSSLISAIGQGQAVLLGAVINGD